MSYLVSMDEFNRFIEVDYQGKVSTSEVETALFTRAQLAHEHAINNHLIDCFLVEEVPSLPDLYRIAENIRNVIDHPIDKVAMVFPNSETINAELLFFVIRAHLHGVWIEMFGNRQNAAQWLANSN